MEILDYQPKTTHNQRLEWKPTILIPVSDVQYGSEACSSARFRRWIERILRLYDNPDYQLLFLGLGDYTDSLRPSMRRKFQQSGMDEDEHIVEAVYDTIQRHHEGFLKLVDGTQGKWIGLLEGHHYFDFGNGVTSDTMLAEKLDTTFLGDCARIHLTFQRTYPNGGKSGSRDFQIWAHHGEGGGMTPGAPLNKLNPLVGRFEADCFLMAHQHKAVTTKVPYCYDVRVKGGWKMTHKDISLTCTGGWLQGFGQGSRNGGRAGGYYPEQKMLTPLSLGGTRIYIEPRHTNHGDWLYHEVTV